MGRHMAANLLKKGHAVTAFDVNEAAVQELVGKGAVAAASAAAAARGSEVVVTMLPSSPHVKAVYEGAGGVLQAAAATAAGSGASPSSSPLLIDCSTIDPNVSRALTAAAAAKGLRLVDAPVSGGVGGAEAGTLTFMVGASDAAAFEAAAPVLRDMGKNIVHTGGPGTGQVAKLCNNLVLGVSMNAVSEAMNIGVKLGADPAVLARIINTSSGRCWSSDTYNPVPGVIPGVPASRGYAGGFGSALMAKDLGLALEAAKSAGAPAPTAAVAHSVYSMMMANGWAGKDFSAVYAFHRGAEHGGGGK
jgi:3-hydroxyisobutyrate dehydrogenase